MLLSFRSELTPNRNPVGTDRRGAELPLRTAQRSSRRRRVARTMVPRDDNGAANCLPPTDVFAVATAECDAARTDPPCCQPRRRAARTVEAGSAIGFNFTMFARQSRPTTNALLRTQPCRQGARAWIKYSSKGTSYNSFTDIEFTCETTHSFKVYNSIVFSIFIESYNRSSISNSRAFSSPPKETLFPLSVVSHPCHPGLWQPQIYFLSLLIFLFSLGYFKFFSSNLFFFLKLAIHTQYF